MTSPYVREALDRVSEVRAAYVDLVYARYGRAEHELNARLLNKRGEAAGIDPLSLFSGPRVRVEAYASEELLEWFETHQRTTYAEFERQTYYGERGDN